jgi:hypothetical protein
MSQILSSPDEIPLHYFYFGWKKAKNFVKQQGFYDPIEMKEFELELEKNLREIQSELSSLSYNITPPIIYGFPKGAKGDELKLRPMSKILFRDQVAWATVVLTIGEWFDTNDSPLSIINENENESDDYTSNWMVDWSCNNRLRRKYFPYIANNTNGFKRLMVNYTHNDLYESFQRSLRLQRKKQEDYFGQVLKESQFAFYGQADITKFYPSLKMIVVEEVLQARLTELNELGMLSIDAKNKWFKILGKLCLIHSDVSYLLEDETKAIGLDEINLWSKSDCLPTGLIASGFLANCVLTHWLDNPMEEFRKEKTKEGNIMFLTRYTDDIMIISSNETVVFESIKKIQELIECIGLKLSEDKTKPKIRGDLIESLKGDFENITTNQANNLVDHFFSEDIRCPRVGRYDALPSSTALIDKLSQLGDQQVRAMRGDELEKYLSEVMDLMKTEFAVVEIRDDTKASFAAWKIRKAANDARYRELSVKQDVTETLMRSFMKYPYKMSLVNCYLLHLMEMPFDETVENLLIEMFKSAKKTDVVTQPGFYGSYMRTHIQFTIAENWSNVIEENRPRIREIILEQVMNWYMDGNSPTWHERYAIYWLFSNCNIEADLELFTANTMESVKRVSRLYNLMKREPEHGNDSVLVAVMSDVWRRNRPREYSKFESSDEINWINWVWSKISNSQRSWEWKREGHGRVWIEITGGREGRITTYGFRRLMELTELHLTGFFEDNELIHGGEESLEIIPIYNGIIEILNQAITLWVGQSDTNFSQRFLKAIRTMPEETRIRKYLTTRIANLREIEIALLTGTGVVGRIPNFARGISSNCIPLQDWLEVINILPQRLEKIDRPKELLPLMEAEITTLLINLGSALLNELEASNSVQQNQILAFSGRENLLSKVSLNRISFSIEDWEGWRNKHGECKITFSEDYVIFSEFYLSAWIYMDVMFADEEYLLCYSFSMLLLRLISNKNHNTHGSGITRLRGWKKISDVITQAEFPSTEIAEIITGSMNYQKPFYENVFLNAKTELPLLPLEKEPIVKVSEYLTRLEGHLALLQKRFFIGDTGLREMRFIDIDKLVKE